MRTPPLFLSFLLLAMMKWPLGCGEHKAQSHGPAPAGTNAPSSQVSAGQPPVAKPLPVPENGPSVIIASPVRNEVVDSSDVGVFLKVQGLPPDGGAHVHIMLDDQPPERVTDPMLPIVFHGVKPGSHVVRAFACDGDHISFKNRTAFAMVWFKVAGMGEGVTFDPALPTLTLNLPAAACSRADEKNLPVDFLLSGLPLNDMNGWRVRVLLDGEQKFLLDASNYIEVFLPSLAGGVHAVRLELMDGHGRTMKANFGWSERTVRAR
jgi:hypothetical protein